MKALLTAINCKYIHSNLAVYSLKSYAKEYEQHIEIAEFTINHYVDYILQEIYKKKPDVILLSCYIWNLDYMKELIGELVKILPGTPIWLGGPEVSYDAETFLKDYPMICGIMIGEGEKSFLQLMQYYVKRDIRLGQISGISYRDKKCDIISNPCAHIIDMDTIPFVYSNLREFENRIIYYETSRGCPFACSYCLSSIDKRVRFRSFDIVKNELQFFLDHKVPQVKFVDRTFNCNHKHAVSIWEYIKEHDNGITNFHFEISADLLTDEEIRLLSDFRPGLVQLEIGVQSTNPKTISEIDRSMDYMRLKDAVNRVRQGNNIHQHLDLIAGLPHEDYDSFGQSFNDVYSLKPDQLQLGFLKVLKGSKMHDKAGDYGIHYRDRPTYEVLCTKWLSYEEIIRLKFIEEMVEVYYNSGQFNRTMYYLADEFEQPFKCYEALADYYEENGLFHTSYSRLRRYEILLEFMKEHIKEHFQSKEVKTEGQMNAQIEDHTEDHTEQHTEHHTEHHTEQQDKIHLYEELLLYDLYLRENIKSRPHWARELSEYQGTIREFYQEEERLPRYLQGYDSYNYKQLGKMTHLEPFSYNVMGDGTKGEYYVLFDYKIRNPLTYEAQSYLIHV